MESPHVKEIVTLATNSFDAWATKVQSEGVDLNERVDRLLPLLLKLTDPKFLDIVETMTEKSTSLEQVLHATEEIPKVLSTGVNTMDAFAETLQDQGVDINERIDGLVPLLIKLSDPKFMRVMEKMADKSDLIEQAIDASEELPKILVTGVNTVDALIAQMQDNGEDIDQRLENVIKIANILTSSKMVRFLSFFDHHMERFLTLGNKFVDADQLNAKFAAFLEDATTSLVETTCAPAKPIKGIFSMLGVMKDENVSRTMGFAVELAKSFGRNIRHRG